MPVFDENEVKSPPHETRHTVVCLLQALLTWRDPTATRMVMSALGLAAVAVGLVGLPTCLCAFLLYQVGAVPCGCGTHPCTALPWRLSSAGCQIKTGTYYFTKPVMRRATCNGMLGMNLRMLLGTSCRALDLSS